MSEPNSELNDALRNAVDEAFGVGSTPRIRVIGADELRQILNMRPGTPPPVEDAPATDTDEVKSTTPRVASIDMDDPIVLYDDELLAARLGISAVDLLLQALEEEGGQYLPLELIIGTESEITGSVMLDVDRKPVYCIDRFPR